MNMILKKFNPGYLILGGAAVCMTTLLASVQPPAQTKMPIELLPQITIDSSKYSVSSLDLGPYNDCTRDCHAELLTKDGKYAVAVNFDYSGYDKGYSNQLAGYQIERMEPEYVVDESGQEVNAYIDRYEIEKINSALEDSIAEKLQKLGG